MSFFGRKKNTAPGLAALAAATTQVAAEGRASSAAATAESIGAAYAERTRDLASQADVATSVDDLRAIVKSLGEVQAEGLEEISKAAPLPEEAEPELDEDLEDGDFSEHEEAPSPEDVLAKVGLRKSLSVLATLARTPQSHAAWREISEYVTQQATLSKSLAQDGPAFQGEAVDAGPVLEELSNQLAEANARADASAEGLSKALSIISRVEAKLDGPDTKFEAQTSVQVGISKSLDAMGMRPRGSVSGSAPAGQGTISKGLATGASDSFNTVDVSPAVLPGRTLPQISKSLHAHFMAGRNETSNLPIDYMHRLANLTSSEMAQVNAVVDWEEKGDFTSPIPAPTS